jgi:hypothetical protein
MDIYEQFWRATKEVKYALKRDYCIYCNIQQYCEFAKFAISQSLHEENHPPATALGFDIVICKTDRVYLGLKKKFVI